MLFTLTTAALTTALLAIEPLQLQALTILNECPPAPGWAFPQVDDETLCAITAEFLNYTAHCHQLIEDLADLPPAPLEGVCIPEYCL